MSLLRYEDFSISFGLGRREKFAVNHLDLEIGIGERVALVGESGSGKSVTSMSILQLIPSPPATYKNGSILFLLCLYSFPVSRIRICSLLG